MVLAEAPKTDWVWGTAYAIPKETTSEESGYFSIIEGLTQPGKSGLIYIGTAKYGVNAYLVEFNPDTKQMRVVVDAQKEIGTTATGFAAQSKIPHPQQPGRQRQDLLRHQAGLPSRRKKSPIISADTRWSTTPRPARPASIRFRSRTTASSASRPTNRAAWPTSPPAPTSGPIDSSHFMILNLETGKYRDLIDAQHMYAFIVVDHLGRAYHPILGGDIARWDPQSEKLERLKQTIDGKPPAADSHLADAESHPINWDISPDRKTLYSVAMSGNQLYSYDLTAPGDTLARARPLGKLMADATSTDCRGMCVGPEGDVWAAGPTLAAGDRTDRCTW